MTTKIKKFNHDDTKSILRKYIVENFLPSSGLNAINESDSFMEKGILDSTGILELIAFIENEFGIEVEDEEIIPDNLDSLEKVAFFFRKEIFTCC